MQNQLWYLGILCIISACSTSSNISTVNPDQQLLTEAINQIGGVQGYEAYLANENQSSPNDQISARHIYGLYLNSNLFKQAEVTIYNGSIGGGEQITTFNNEIAFQNAYEGSFTTTSTFSLVDTGGNPITDPQGFSTLYILTPTKIKDWTTVKLGGNSTWQPNMNLFARNFVVKKGENTLTFISAFISSGGNISINRSALTDLGQQIVYKKS